MELPCYEYIIFIYIIYYIISSIDYLLSTLKPHLTILCICTWTFDNFFSQKYDYKKKKKNDKPSKTTDLS